MSIDVDQARVFCCPACSMGVSPPVELCRNEENRTYYCSICGIEWGLLIFDVDAAEVVETFPFIFDVHADEAEVK